jgi:hypothetical protein
MSLALEELGAADASRLLVALLVPDASSLLWKLAASDSFAYQRLLCARAA